MDSIMNKGIVFMGILSAALLATVVGMLYKKPQVSVEDIDAAWKLGALDSIEKQLELLVGKSLKQSDKSVHIQALSQMALVSALQKKFTLAHEILDKAQDQVNPNDDLATVRLLLERGRVFQQQVYAGLQSKQVEEVEAYNAQARSYFKLAYQLSAQCGFDRFSIDAAHMIAIMQPGIEDKIQWNQRAIDIIEKTEESVARSWGGSLYNNLGQNYFDNGQYEKSLEAYQKSLECRQDQQDVSNSLFAKWTVARSLRMLDRCDEALVMQLELEQVYGDASDSDYLGMNPDIFILTRGFVFQELAEIYKVLGDVEKTRHYAQIALDDLSGNTMITTTSPDQLNRLQNILRS